MLENLSGTTEGDWCQVLFCGTERSTLKRFVTLVAMTSLPESSIIQQKSTQSSDYRLFRGPAFTFFDDSDIGGAVGKLLA